MADMANIAPGDMAIMVQAFRDAETHILGLIARAVSRGATGTANHYANQLQALRTVLDGADKALQTALETTGQEVAGLLAANWQTAAVQAMPGVMAPAMPEQAINSLALETVGALGSVRHNVLRDVEDIYRRVTQVVATRGVMTGEALQARLQGALNTFADRGITAFVDKAGRRWGIDTYAEMALRTATNRAQNDGRRAQFQAHGVDLIRVSAHRACAPQCLPFQGKVLSISGPAGPRTLTMPDSNQTYFVDVVATRDQAIAEGYRHPNCRHTETAYMPGSKEPTPVKTNEAEYRAEQRQRQIERNIRHWKKREAVATTPEDRARAHRYVKSWQTQQRAHLKQHTFLARRYDREQIRQANGPGTPTPPLPRVA